MTKRRFLVGTVAVVATLLGMLTLSSAEGVSAAGIPFQTRLLTSDSLVSVGAYALSYARTYYRFFGADPQVRLVRPVTRADLEALGFGQVALRSDTSYDLVILKGEFDLRGAGPGTRGLTCHYAYVGLVFNLRDGYPPFKVYSRNGWAFRIALHDMSMGPNYACGSPTSAPTPAGGVMASVAPVGMPAVPTVPMWDNQEPYGSVAPPAPTATEAPAKAG
jgi:hypothetical protein